MCTACSDPEALAEGADPALLGLELVAVPPNARCYDHSQKAGAETGAVVHDVSFTLPVHLRYHKVRFDSPVGIPRRNTFDIPHCTSSRQATDAADHADVTIPLPVAYARPSAHTGSPAFDPSGNGRPPVTRYYDRSHLGGVGNAETYFLDPHHCPSPTSTAGEEEEVLGHGEAAERCEAHLAAYMLLRCDGCLPGTTNEGSNGPAVDEEQEVVPQAVESVAPEAEAVALASPVEVADVAAPTDAAESLTDTPVVEPASSKNETVKLYLTKRPPGEGAPGESKEEEVPPALPLSEGPESAEEEAKAASVPPVPHEEDMAARKGSEDVNNTVDEVPLRDAREATVAADEAMESTQQLTPPEEQTEPAVEQPAEEVSEEHAPLPPPPPPRHPEEPLPEAFAEALDDEERESPTALGSNEEHANEEDPPLHHPSEPLPEEADNEALYEAGAASDTDEAEAPGQTDVPSDIDGEGDEPAAVDDVPVNVTDDPAAALSPDETSFVEEESTLDPSAATVAPEEEEAKEVEEKEHRAPPAPARERPVTLEVGVDGAPALPDWQIEQMAEMDRIEEIMSHKSRSQGAGAGDGGLKGPRKFVLSAEDFEGAGEEGLGEEEVEVEDWSALADSSDAAAAAAAARRGATKEDRATAGTSGGGASVRVPVATTITTTTTTTAVKDDSSGNVSGRRPGPPHVPVPPTSATPATPAIPAVAVARTSVEFVYLAAALATALAYALAALAVTCALCCTI